MIIRDYTKRRKFAVVFYFFMICILVCNCMMKPVTAAEKTDNEIKQSELYARYAVLMDADSGRILYSKSGESEAPMASTTKIMTCILTLENTSPSDIAQVSENAVSQPEVKLGMYTGQKFLVKDLLYSLMLESHNDSAVVIAEHVGGSVEEFASMMNKKAEEIGCTSTYFITPNGLDAEDKNGKHHTTASDLARIMRYCICQSPRSADFLKITRTGSYSFTDLDGRSSYSCANHNAFLRMMEGALTGKTGFTSEAGYCYVGALKRDDRTFIVALLACGWPGNKGYKWADTRKLMNYALDNYTYRELKPPENNFAVTIKDGYIRGCPQSKEVTVGLQAEGDTARVLMKSDETIETEYYIPENLKPPLSKGDRAGEINLFCNGYLLAAYPLVVAEDVKKRDIKICFTYVCSKYMLK